MAQGDTLWAADALGFFLDPTNPPERVIRGSAPGTPTLSYDDTTDEIAYAVGVMPGQYDTSKTLVVKIGAVHVTDGETAIAGEFEISLARFQDDVDNVETPTFDTAQALSWTSGSANDEIAYDTLAISNANLDGIQKNEGFMLRITFDASVWSGNGGNGDVQLVTVDFQEGT